MQRLSDQAKTFSSRGLLELQKGALKILLDDFISILILILLSAQVDSTTHKVDSILAKQSKQKSTITFELRS